MFCRILGIIRDFQDTKELQAESRWIMQFIGSYPLRDLALEAGTQMSTLECGRTLSEKQAGDLTKFAQALEEVSDDPYVYVEAGEHPALFLDILRCAYTNGYKQPFVSTVEHPSIKAMLIGALR